MAMCYCLVSACKWRLRWNSAPSSSSRCSHRGMRISRRGCVGLQATRRLSSEKEFRMTLLCGRGEAESSWTRLIRDQRNTPWNQTRPLPKDRGALWARAWVSVCVCVYVCVSVLALFSHSVWNCLRLCVCVLLCARVCVQTADGREKSH